MSSLPTASALSEETQTRPVLTQVWSMRPSWPIVTLAALINLSSLEYFFAVRGMAASLSREML
jgi:hypothetical protein